MSFETDDVRKVLVEARGLIEKGWTQNTFARDAEGVEVASFAPSAVCWCAVGALKRASYSAVFNEGVSPMLYCDAYVLLGNRLFSSVGKSDIPKWNDAPERTKEEVLAMFDKAIESLV